MTKYIAEFVNDDQGYKFLKAIKKFGKLRLEDCDKTLFKKGLRLTGYYDANVRELDFNDIYTFEITDSALSQDNENVLENNVNFNDPSKFYGKILRIQRTVRNDITIDLKTISEDKTCSELFFIQNGLDEIYNDLNNFILDHKPVTNLIYLTDEKKVIGPFFSQKAESTVRDDEYKLIPYDSTNYMTDVYLYSDFIEYCSKVKSFDTEEKYVLIYNKIKETDNYIKCQGTQDCMPIETLLKWFKKKCNKNIDITSINQTFSLAQENDPELSGERKQRLIAYVQKSETNNRQIEDLKRALAKDETVINFVLKEKQNLDENKAKEVEREYKKKIGEYQTQIKEKESKILHLEEEIKNSKSYNEEYVKDLEKKVKQNKDLEEIEKEFFYHTKRNEELQEDISKAKDEIKNAKETSKEIIEAFEQLLKEKYNDKEASKLVLSNSINNAFIGKILKVASDVQNETFKNSIVPMTYDKNAGHKKYNEAKEMIDDIFKYYTNAGRKYTKNDIANIIICMSQGFLTIFAGEPGTGKTSFVKHFSQFLGLQNKFSQRYAEITVEKGWTTKRDLLGYYNPLTKEINIGNRELYNGLELLNKEVEQNVEDFPYIILLDEANLSPMEYYWADFMKICDYNENNKINFFDDYDLKIPKTLKFFATINLDHTTEILSPRLIDRSWIIKLPQENFSLEDKLESSLSNQEYPLVCNNIFKEINEIANDPSIISSAVIDKFEAIQELFKSQKIYFSPRTIVMIQKYCIVSKTLELFETYGNELIPLDYAISQKILPMINGQGESYSTFIESLIDLTDKMPICNKILKDIETNAKRNGLEYYHFFAR